MKRFCLGNLVCARAVVAVVKKYPYTYAAKNEGIILRWIQKVQSNHFPRLSFPPLP